jgi:hypothetical protein
MQRAESASDAEARARLRGFALNSALQQVEASMGQVDSRLAGAKLMAAKALIQKEMVKSDFEVQQHIDSAANAAASRNTTAMGHELQASTAASEMKSRERIAALNLLASQKTAAPGDEFEGVIADVSETGDTRITRKFIKGTTNDKQSEIRTRAALMTSIAEGTAHLIKLQKEAGARPELLGDTRFMGEAKRTALALERYNQLAIAYAKSGKAINETEIKFTGDFFKDDTWLTNGDNVRKLSSIMGRLIKETNLEIEANSYLLSPSDPAYGKKLGRANFIEGLAAEAEVDSSADGGKVKSTRTDRAVESLGRPDASEPASPEWRVEGTSGDNSPSKTWKDYIAERPVTSTLESASDGLDDIKRRKQAKHKAETPAAAFVSMDILRQEAEGTGPDAARSRELLEAWALLGTGEVPDIVAPDLKSDPNSEASQEKRDYAVYQYKLLKEHEREQANRATTE